MDVYRKVQLYFEWSEEMTEFVLQMCRDTKFAEAGVTFSHVRADREVEVRFEVVGIETNAIIMGVNAIPFGPPIGVIVFFTVLEDITLGEKDHFTLDGPEFAINLGQPDDFAESWVFSVPSLRVRSYGAGNLLRIWWSDQSVMAVEDEVEYENSLPVNSIDAL